MSVSFIVVTYSDINSIKPSRKEMLILGKVKCFQIPRLAGLNQKLLHMIHMTPVELNTV